MNIKLLAFCFAFPALVIAQTNERVYDPDICSVQFRLSGSPLSRPIVNLKTGYNVLSLHFDHMGYDIKDYKYTLTHCNSDWMPSELNDNEYIDGYTEDRITTIQSSFNTLVAYTHYTLLLPNANMRWAVSGNYLLKIFDADDDDRLVIVRRFMVVEGTWRIDGEFVRTAKVDKMDTHTKLTLRYCPRARALSYLKTK
jgi:hypothetical protein